MKLIVFVLKQRRLVLRKKRERGKRQRDWKPNRKQRPMHWKLKRKLEKKRPSEYVLRKRLLELNRRPKNAKRQRDYKLKRKRKLSQSNWRRETRWMRTPI